MRRIRSGEARYSGVRFARTGATAVFDHLTFELSPPALHQLGLGPALEELCRQFAQREGLQVLYRPTWNGPQLPQDLRIALYRSARELLHNVTKHARTDRAGLKLEERTGRAYLTVSDAGEGMVMPVNGAQGQATDGFGLFSIQQRIEALGGTFSISSQPGTGSSVTLSVPLALVEPNSED